MKTRFTNILVILVIFATIILVVSPSIQAVTLELYEEATNTSTGYRNIYGATTYACGQTFTIGTIGIEEAILIRNITFFCRYLGTPPNLNVSIWTTTASHTPNVMKEYKLFPYSFSTSGTQNWFNVSFNGACVYHPNIEYAIVLWTNGGTSGNTYRMYYGSDTYSGGYQLYSTSGYTNLGVQSGYDTAFKIWGISADANITYSNPIPTNSSSLIYSVDIGLMEDMIISTKNILTVNITKTSPYGFNTTSYIFFNDTLIGTNTWVNGTKGFPIMDNYGKSLVNNTVYYWKVNSKFYRKWYNTTYHFTFIINLSNIPSSTECDNTSLTIINNTVNVTGKYESYYSALTGWVVYLNYTGITNITGNMTGTYNITLNLISLDGLSFSVNWSGDYIGNGTNVTIPVNSNMNIVGTLEVLNMVVELDLTQMSIIMLLILSTLFLLIAIKVKDKKFGALILLIDGVMFIYLGLGLIALFGAVWLIISPGIVLIGILISVYGFFSFKD